MRAAISHDAFALLSGCSHPLRMPVADVRSARSTWSEDRGLAEVKTSAKSNTTRTRTTARSRPWPNRGMRSSAGSYCCVHDWLHRGEGYSKHNTGFVSLSANFRTTRRPAIVGSGSNNTASGARYARVSEAGRRFPPLTCRNVGANRPRPQNGE
jgi:hypothetical protein